MGIPSFFFLLLVFCLDDSKMSLRPKDGRGDTDEGACVLTCHERSPGEPQTSTMSTELCLSDKYIFISVWNIQKR